MGNLNEIEEILYELKEDIPEGKYLKIMNALQKISNCAKKVLIAIPVIKDQRFCTTVFNLAIECIYVTITKEDYKYYDSLKVGGYFDVSEYAPLRLMFSQGVLRYQPHPFCNFTMVGESIYGKVIQIHNLEGINVNQSSESLADTSSESVGADEDDLFFDHVPSSPD